MLSSAGEKESPYCALSRNAQFLLACYTCPLLLTNSGTSRSPPAKRRKRVLIFIITLLQIIFFLPVSGDCWF
jgi:hypothetical protein